jgi:hypothetical protein
VLLIKYTCCSYSNKIESSSRPNVWGSIPCSSKKFSFFCNVHADSGFHPSPCSMNTGALSSGIKWPAREAVHSLPPSAKVKNELYLCSPSMSICEAQGQLHLRVAGQRLPAVRRILQEFRYISNSDALLPYFGDLSHSRLVVRITMLFICHGFDIFHNFQTFYIWSFSK